MAHGKPSSPPTLLPKSLQNTERPLKSENIVDLMLQLVMNCIGDEHAADGAAQRDLAEARKVIVDELKIRFAKFSGKQA